MSYEAQADRAREISDALSIDSIHAEGPTTGDDAREAVAYAVGSMGVSAMMEYIELAEAEAALTDNWSVNDYRELLIERVVDEANEGTEWALDFCTDAEAAPSEELLGNEERLYIARTGLALGQS